MKKLILFFLPFLCVLANGEELKFVTVLSSPVGSFNKLETVDDETPVRAPVINFCTSIGENGTITLKGKNHPTMNTLSLSDNTTLGGNGSNYVLKEITMRPGGTLKGSRLLANTVQVNYQTAGKSDNLYTESLTVAGAKATTLNINNGESKITATRAPAEMVWSNEYQDDAACGTPAQCAKQYLLKQKSNAGLCSQTGYFMGHLSECCQTTRTKTDEYFVRYPGADASFRTDECSAGSNSAYTCTTGDFVNKKVCNEYVLDTSSGSSSSWRYPVGGTFTGSWKSVQKTMTIPYQKECWAALPSRNGCSEISIDSLNVSGGDGYPSRLHEWDPVSLCKTHYSPGGPLYEDGYETCSIPTCATTATGGRCNQQQGCPATYYLSTLYCKNSSESASSSYHITVNRVACCSGR